MITPHRLAALRAERDAEQSRRMRLSEDRARRLDQLQAAGRALAASSLTYAQIMALQSVRGALQAQRAHRSGTMNFGWLQPILGAEGCTALGLGDDDEALSFLAGVCDVAALVLSLGAPGSSSAPVSRCHDK